MNKKLFQTMEEELLNEVVKETKRRLIEESVPRLKKCLNKLTIDEIWYSPNKHTVSAGNLVLHLCGNARQWIVSALGGKEDKRVRYLEFETKERVAKAVLIKMLDSLTNEVEQTLNKLQPKDLLEIKEVQVYKESGLAILMHVVEHFSYHVGQVTYITKSIKNIDLKYYGNQNLETQ